MTNEKIVIIGAPRSGTNMLRDVLTSFDGIGTWPCDEINYIWRHGNVRYPSDEIPASKASASVRSYIRKQFSAIARAEKAHIVVEKTCANSLRVPFVDAVLPDAKYIYIYRDGIDAVGSAKLRWTAKMELPYLLAKVRYVPPSDLPYYALRYLWARIYQRFSSEKRLAFWGPSLEDMQSIIRAHSLNEICALQWQRCVTKADEALSQMPSDKVVRVCYENFVRNPRQELKRLQKYIGFKADEAMLSNAVVSISDKSIGKGRQLLGDEEVNSLELLIQESLKRYGYI